MTRKKENLLKSSKESRSKSQGLVKNTKNQIAQKSAFAELLETLFSNKDWKKLLAVLTFLASFIVSLRTVIMVATAQPLIRHFTQVGSVGLIFIGEGQLLHQLQILLVENWQIQLLQFLFNMLLYEYLKIFLDRPPD